jgi:phosphoadenosine phosphosulfate reductase
MVDASLRVNLRDQDCEMVLAEKAARLEQAYADSDAATILTLAMRELFPGRIALVSSFGAESAVLLHLASRIDRAVPVIFLDTGMLFPETLAYRRTLVRHLGLRDVSTHHPDPVQLATLDAGGTLHASAPNLCCHIRKVAPLERALEGYDAWITGRKQFQGQTRARLGLFEVQDGRLKLNPLARWSAHQIDDYMSAHGLPRHPLSLLGYPSIGCMPCTSPVGAGEAVRDGRWRGLTKTECGIHRPSNARLEALECP